MLLAAAPGGASANIYSHLARGDVALNITLTAVNSILCLVTLPIVLNFSLAYFLGAGQYVPPPTRKVVEVAADHPHPGHHRHGDPRPLRELRAARRRFRSRSSPSWCSRH